MNRRTLIATTGACVGAGLAAPGAAGAAPAYAVEIVETNLPIAGGDRFEATVRVTNAGDAAGEDRSVRLLAGGDFIAVDVDRVSLAAGDATEVTLGYDTFPVQVDVEFPIRVETVDDAAETTIQVAGADRTADGSMDVAITDVDDEGVRGGESLSVTARFDNTGDTRINTVAKLVSVGQGAVVNEGQVVVDPGESNEMVFPYETYPVQTDVAFDLAVCTPYGSDVATVTVAAQGSDPDGTGPFAVSVYQTNDPVAGGEFLEVVASFANGGPETGTFTAELVVGDEVVDTRDIDMARESTVIRTLGYDTYPVATDSTFPVTVRTPDDSATAQVTVFGVGDDGEGTHPGPVTATIDSTTAPVTGGERLDVTATLTNGGTARADAVAELVVGGEVVDTQAVTLAADASQAVTVGYETYPVKNDSTFEVTVRTADDSVATPVTVYGTESDGSDGDGSDDGGGSDSGGDDGGTPSLSVSIANTSAPVQAGQQLTVTATVANGGGATASETAALVVGGEMVDTASVSVPAGGSTTVSLGYTTYAVEQDVSFPVTVSVGDASASTSVSVTAD